MKVLHVLNHSFPHLDGYSVRSLNIVEFQRSIGWDPVVVTSPQHEPPFEQAQEEIRGIRHFRTARAGSRLPPVVRELVMMRALRHRLEPLIAAERPDVIHAHSPCHWGRVALAAAHARGLPFIYEIRSFWEDGIIDQGRDPRWSPKYHATRRLESSVVRAADAVVTIAAGLKHDLVARGLDADKMFVVPNGVEADRFAAMPLDAAAAPGRCRLAYIGSLYPWEGVDTVIRALPALCARVPGVHLEIVGDGVERPRLERLSRELGVGDAVGFTGRVSHDAVTERYRDADICIYPRNSSRTTELVTPLKPLEAMAMGKPVIASDVGGLRELLTGADATFFVPGDAASFAERCVELLDRRHEWPAIAARNREFVLRDKAWSTVLGAYRAVYARVLPAANRHA